MAVISEARPPNSGNPNPTGFARWWERTTNTRAAYLYLVPAFIVMGIITFYPMFYQVWMSFTDFGIKNLRGTIPPNVVGLDNYQRILTGALQTKIANFSFWRILAFNLVWTITNVPIHVVLGVLIAANVGTIVPVLESVFRFHVMDPSVYYITQIPAELRIGQIAAITLVAFTLTVVATIYPAIRGAATEPA
jgi:ABC-type maltose transport system permease subunit